MNSVFDKLNLQPHERRFVIIGIVILLLLLNYLVIWPYFKQWTEVTGDLAKVTAKNEMFQKEINQKSKYEKRIAELKKNEGANILDLPENERANYVLSAIQGKAAANAVLLNSIRQVATISRSGNQTNQFFDEITFSTDVNSGEAELVNFLYELGASEAMIRVRGINNLGLDPTQHKLKASLTLVASFQRKTPLPAPKPVAATNKQPAKAVPSRGSATNAATTPAAGNATNKPSRKP